MDAARDDERRRRFERVMAEVYEPLQRYLLRRTDPSVADDVLADVLLVLWRRLDDVPPDGVLPWSYGVARGCLANHRRGAERRERLVLRLQHAYRDAPDDTGDDRGLEQALAELPDGDREVLRLWAWEQLAPREIATALGISANAASIRLHRAKGRLRKALTTGKGSGAAGQLGMRDGGGAAR